MAIGNHNDLTHIVRTSDQWKNTYDKYELIPAGVLCVELVSPDVTKIKIGDGHNIFSKLPYIGDLDLSKYYTKLETDTRIKEILTQEKVVRIKGIIGSKSDLPADARCGDIYFVRQLSSSDNKYIEYIYSPDNTWEPLGGIPVDIDLSEYAKTAYVDDKIEQVNERIDDIEQQGTHTHPNKEILDQITEPYTTADKETLASLHNYDDTEIREMISQSSHTHSNKDILDATSAAFTREDKSKLDQLNPYDDSTIKERITELERVAHEHSNKRILDQTTASFTKEYERKMRWIRLYTGCTGMEEGIAGLVPAAQAGEEDYVLSGSGEWVPQTGGGGTYELPIATTSTLGGIKVGDGLTIDANGVLSTTGGGGGGDTITEGGGISITTDPQTGDKVISVNVGDNLEIDPQTGELNVTDVDYSAGQGINIGQNVSTLYTEVEYLESTGTQYILSDIEINYTMKTKLDVRFGSSLYSSATGTIPFGIQSSSAWYLGAFEYGTGSYNYFSYYDGYGWSSEMSQDHVIQNVSYDTRNDVIIQRDVCSYGNQSCTLTIPVSQNDPTIPLVLFGTNRNSTVSAFDIRDMYLYGATIYDSSNDIIHDLVPVKRNIDNKPGLYDIITDKFYINNGTGEFTIGSIVGPLDVNKRIVSAKIGNGLQFDSNDAIEVNLGDGLRFDSNGAIEVTGGGGGDSIAEGDGITITTDSQTGVKTISVNTGDHLSVDSQTGELNVTGVDYEAGNGIRIGSNYNFLEYIKNSGNYDQIILTDILPKYDNKLVIDMQFGVGTGLTNNVGFYGVRENNTSVYCTSMWVDSGDTWTTISTYNHFDYEQGQQSHVFSVSSTAKYHGNNPRQLFTVHQNIATWGNDTINFADQYDSSLSDPTLPFAIFGRNINGVLNPFYTFELFVYGVKLYDSNNVLIHDLRPVERVSDNAAGLYDILTNKFYGNAGGGSFVKGPAVTTPDRIINAKIGNGLQFDSNNAIEVNTGDGLQINQDGELEIDPSIIPEVPDYRAGEAITIRDVSSTLPTGYVEVDYIEGVGNYTVINYIPNRKTKIIGTASQTQTSYDPVLFGNRTGNSGQQFVFWFNKYDSTRAKVGFVYGTNTWSTSSDCDNGKLISYTLGDQFTFLISLDDEFNINDSFVHNITENGAPASNLKLGIFALVNTASDEIESSDQIFRGKIYEFKIYEDDELVVNLIPAISTSTNQSGFYDVINDIFYTSKTATPFGYDPSTIHSTGKVIDVNYGNGLIVNQDNELEVNIGTGLAFDPITNELFVNGQLPEGTIIKKLTYVGDGSTTNSNIHFSKKPLSILSLNGLVGQNYGSVISTPIDAPYLHGVWGGSTGSGASFRSPMSYDDTTNTLSIQNTSDVGLAFNISGETYTMYYLTKGHTGSGTSVNNEVSVVKTFSYVGTGTSTNNIQFPETPDMVLSVIGENASSSISIIQPIEIEYPGSMLGECMVTWGDGIGGSIDSSLEWTFNDTTNVLSLLGDTASHSSNISGKVYVVRYIVNEVIASTMPYDAGEAISIETIGGLQLTDFSNADFIASITRANAGDFVKAADNSTIALSSWASDCYTVGIGGDNSASGSYAYNVKANTQYRLEWDSSDPTIQGRIMVFENAGYDNVYVGEQSQTSFIEFTTTSNCTFITTRLGITNAYESVTYSNVRLYEYITDGNQYNEISVKHGNGLSVNQDNELEVNLGSGLSFDANGAIQVTGGGGGSGDTVTQGAGIEITTDQQTGNKVIAVNAGNGLQVDQTTNELEIDDSVVTEDDELSLVFVPDDYQPS